MKTSFNLNDRLNEPETQRFLKRYSEAHGIDRQVTLRDVPIKNFVDVDANLLETKVASLFLQGARDASDFWSNLIKVHQMTSPQEEIPVISERDFEVRRGKIARTQSEQSGGRVRTVSLDTRNDDLIRYIYLPIDREDIRLHRFNVVEETLVAAGRRFARNILGDIIKHYVNKAGNTQALGADKRFIAVMKAIALLKKDGFSCNAIVIDSDDYVEAITEETTNGTMPWLLTLAGTPLGSNFGNGVGSDGLSGALFGRIPVFQVANDSNLSGNILCVDTQSAAVFGWAPGGQIETEQEIKRIDDLIENAIRAKYDIANPDDDGSGNTNAVAKVTGV